MRKIKLTEAQLKYCIAHSHLNEASDVTIEVGPEDQKDSSKIAAGVNAFERNGVNANVVPAKNPAKSGERTTPEEINKVAQTSTMMESFSKKDFEKLRKGKK